MIFKSFELDKSNLTKFKLFVIYGENEGLKQEIINKIKGSKTGKEIKLQEPISPLGLKLLKSLNRWK